MFCHSRSRAKSKLHSASFSSALAIVFIFLGSVFKADLVWELTDVFNNLMVIPNVIALFALSSSVVSEIKRRDREKKLKIDKNSLQ